MPSVGTVAWVAFGGFAGVAALAALHGFGVGSALEVRRRFPALVLLDGLPVLLAWVGWLVARLRASQAALAALDAQLGPFSSGIVADTVLDALIIVDASGRVVAANAAGRRWYGREPAGLYLRDILVDLDRTEPIERHAPNGQLLGIEWRFTARTAARTVQVRASCAPLPQRQVLYVIETEPPAQSIARAEVPPAPADARLLPAIVRYLTATLPRLAPADQADVLSDVACWVAQGDPRPVAAPCLVGPVLHAVRKRLGSVVGSVIVPDGLAAWVGAEGLAQLVAHLAREVAADGGSVQLVAGADPDRNGRVRVEITDRPAPLDDVDHRTFDSSGAQVGAAATGASLWLSVPAAPRQATLIPTSLVPEEERETDPPG